MTMTNHQPQNEITKEIELLIEQWKYMKPWQRKFLRAQGEIIYFLIRSIDLMYRTDLWLFPPLAFFSAYLAANNNFPDHPIKIFAVLACSFMFATLTLFLIRPRRWRRSAHWLKS